MTPSNNPIVNWAIAPNEHQNRTAIPNQRPTTIVYNAYEFWVSVPSTQPTASDRTEIL
jgi:hypothetical protein